MTIRGQEDRVDVEQVTGPSPTTARARCGIPAGVGCGSSTCWPGTSCAWRTSLSRLKRECVRAPRGALVALQDEQVVGVQGAGDQPGGLLRCVQCVQGEQHAGQVQRCKQIFGHGGLAAFVGDLTLAQDHRPVVDDRGDQEHLPDLGAGAVQQLPCRGRRPSTACRTRRNVRSLGTR